MERSWHEIATGAEIRGRNIHLPFLEPRIADHDLEGGHGDDSDVSSGPTSTHQGSPTAATVTAGTMATVITSSLPSATSSSVNFAFGKFVSDGTTYISRNADGDSVPISSIPTTLATATDPRPPSASLAQSTSTITPPPQSLDKGNDIKHRLDHFLIAAGAIGGCMLVIFSLLILHRIRKGTWKGFVRPINFRRFGRFPKSGHTPLLQSTTKEWDFTSTYGSRGKASPSYKAGSLPTSPYPPSTKNTSTSPITSPAPLVLANNTHIIRERNNLLFPSLSCQPLSTLEEQSLHRSESPSHQTPRLSPLPHNRTSGGGFNNYDHNNRRPPPSPTRSHTSSNNSLLEISANVTAPLSSPFYPTALKPRKKARPAHPSPAISPTQLPLPLPPPPPPPPPPDSYSPNHRKHGTADPDRLFSHFSWGNSQPPPTPEMEYTSLEPDRVSVAASVESAPRFRTVSGWVAHQKTRADRKAALRAAADAANAEDAAEIAAEAARQAGTTEGVEASVEAETAEEVKRRRKQESREREDEEAAIGRGAERAAKREKEQQLQSFRDLGSRHRSRHRKIESASTATVFKYHPGTEVRLGRGSRVESEVLDHHLGWRAGI
ncbi:MAG: hypothetical protein M1837_002506 [Sclerophora amabilis]|nr:MAG: hypothetical protein M1837_002506 [Sclerophora amabilis]